MTQRALFIGFLVAAAQSVCGGGNSAKYLASVGPTPLRFAVAVEPGVKYPMLPLVMEPVKTEDPVEEPAEETSSLPVAPPGTESKEPAPIENPIIIETPEPVEPPAAPAAPVVTPQMFLRFFSKDGSRETTVITSTNAPAARPPGASSATYTVK